MIFIGIDIGKFKHCAVAVDEHGQECSKPFQFENTLEGFTDFMTFVTPFREKGDICFAMEATGHYWLNLYTFLLDTKIELHVFNPIQTDAVRRMSIRKTKTDTVDCKYIADVVRIGNYSDFKPQTSDIQELRQLCRFRAATSDGLGELKIKVIGILDRIFPEYSKLFSDVFGVASMAILLKYTSPENILKVPTKQLSAFLSKHSRGSFGEAKAIELKEACKSSVGIFEGAPAFVFELRMMIEHIDFCKSQLCEIDRQIEEIYMRCNCFLHTINGIGVISAATILSEIGNINNFESVKKLVAFAGLDPSIKQSGNFESSNNHMSKRGSTYLRRAIWNCAVVAAQRNSVMNAFYKKKRLEGKDYMTSIGAVAHKLCGPIFAVLRDAKPYTQLK